MTARERHYLTTPIYYATGEPHIGHAYTTILADALARYHRQAGRDVFLLTGTDEHGQHVQEEAARRGLEPMELCDRMAAAFRAAWQTFDIAYDRFIRTTEEEHRTVVRAVLERMWRTGQIYRAQYRGWYCVFEERYWTEKDLGPDRTCPDCGRPAREIEEPNYFFRMSAYQERLVRHIEEHPDWIVPASRRNEILGFLRQPLEDLCISRPSSRLHWGIPLPFDHEYVTYVWVDALFNYVTASGIVIPDASAKPPGFRAADHSRWPATLHIVGKDIITTHAVYWPTLLLAVDLPLPRQILAHGWWLSGGTKMSKSKGNVIDPLALAREFGSDAVRYYLLREMTIGQDATYTPDRFQSRYGELANVLGNLASRAASMVLRYRDGRIPLAAANGLRARTEQTITAFRNAMESLTLHEAAAAAMDLARAGNGYVEERAPWDLARDPARAQELDETLATLARTLVVLAALLQPFMPRKMGQLAALLGFEPVPTIVALETLDVGGRPVQKGPVLFPKSAAHSAAGEETPKKPEREVRFQA